MKLSQNCRLRRTFGVVAPMLLGVSILGGCRAISEAPDEPTVSESGEVVYRHPSVYRTFADSALNRGDADAAVRNYEIYVLLRSGDSSGRHDLGRAYLAAGKPGSAREQMLIAYQSEPDNDTYIRGYADALLATGERGRLYEHLRSVATRRNTVQDHLRIAEYANQLGDVDETEGSLLTAAALDRGQTLDVQLRLADFYGQVGDSERQIRRLRMAYFLDSESQAVIDRATALGEIVGPSWRLRPTERPAPRPSSGRGM